MNDTNTPLYRLAWRYGIGACLLLLAIIGLALAGLVSGGPLLWLTIGFLLSIALRQAALMSNVLLWGWRETRWRKGRAMSR
jgi:hypothetical protein